MADSPKNPFMDMFSEFGKSMNLPSPDIEGIMNFHRKNLQALQAATQVQSSAAQDVMEKQRAALEQTLAEISDTIQSAGKSGDMAGMATDQMELARRAFETSLQNTREVAEIVQKGNADTLEVLRARLQESMEELTGKKS